MNTEDFLPGNLDLWENSTENEFIQNDKFTTKTKGT